MPEKGDIITLSNNKEYVCFEKILVKNKEYLYLISNFTPLEIFFATQIYEDGKLIINVVNDEKEKQMLLNLLSNKNAIS